MDKFAAYNDSKGLAMGYYTTKKTSFVSVGSKIRCCDNFFQSVFGGSYLTMFPDICCYARVTVPRNH